MDYKSWGTANINSFLLYLHITTLITMKYILLYFTIICSICATDTFATDTYFLDTTPPDSIENSHFSLSWIQNIGYKLDIQSNEGLRRAYYFSSIQEACSLYIKTHSSSRILTKEEEDYIKYNWPAAYKEKRGKSFLWWKVTHDKDMNTTEFSHPTGIIIKNAYSTNSSCHKKAINLIQHLHIYTGSVYESHISHPLWKLDQDYDSRWYLLSWDTDSLYINNLEENTIWTISQDIEYLMASRLLQLDLKVWWEPKWLVGTGEVQVQGKPVFYIILHRIDQWMPFYMTHYMFSDWNKWIVIFSKTNNPVKNLQSMISIITLENPQLPTLEEILDSNSHEF